MTNYLDPANVDVIEVTTQGGAVLQLGVDWIYSYLLFAINFVTVNFTLIAIIWILTFVAGYGLQKILNKGRSRTTAL